MDSHDIETAQERYERYIREQSHDDSVSVIIEDTEQHFDDGAEYDPLEDRRPDIVKQATRGWRVIGAITQWP